MNSIYPQEEDTSPVLQKEGQTLIEEPDSKSWTARLEKLSNVIELILLPLNIIFLIPLIIGIKLLKILGIWKKE